MTRYAFDEHDSSNPQSTASIVIQWIVRGFGFLLMLAGFLVGVQVLLEAWGLYFDPAGIEQFAQAIESASGLDATLKAGLEDAESSVRISYFVAWFIALTLIMIVGRLAMSAMQIGGQLVLWDVPLRRLVRALGTRRRD